MDAGDRTKKNLAKGGARPKESSRKHRKNSRINRVLNTSDSDSSDQLSANCKTSCKSVSSLQFPITEMGDGCKPLNKTNRRKRARSNSIYKNRDRHNPRNGRNSKKSNEHNLLDITKNVCFKVHEMSHLKPDITTNEWLDNDAIHFENLSDRDTSLSYLTKHIIKWDLYTGSENSDTGKEDILVSAGYHAKRGFSTNTKSTISLHCNDLAGSVKDERKLRRYRKNKNKSLQISDQLYDEAPICSNVHKNCSSPSPQPPFLNGDTYSGDDCVSDTFGSQKTWHLRHCNSIHKENMDVYNNICQFSSSSSEADDEFECDCTFCHNNSNNLGAARMELTRSTLDGRTEMNDQNYADWFDDPPLSPTESAWDVIVQELVEQIRRFNVDIDLFSPSTAMSNSDFESLPTMEPLGPGSCNSQEMQTCTICLCNYEGGEVAKVLPCLHIFHVQCIKLWLAKSSTCPVCRDNVTKKT